MTTRHENTPAQVFELRPDGEVALHRPTLEVVSGGSRRKLEPSRMSSGRTVAIIYIRVSSPKQVRDGMSLEDQIERGQEYCARNGMAVAEVFSDKGLTGCSPDRKGLNDAMAFVRTHQEVTHLFVLNQARWARNIQIIEDTFNEFRELGVKVVGLELTVDCETASGRMMYRLQAVQDMFYAEQAKERAVQITARMRGQGLVTHRASLGYLNARDGRDSILVPDQDKSVHITAVFRGIASGAMSVKDALHHLWAVGVCGRNGRPLSRSSLYRILKNPVYAGMVRQPDGRLIPGRIEPLASEQDFLAVQRILNRKYVTAQGKEGFLLAKLLFCGNCGSLMTTTSKLRKNTEYRYYHCPLSCSGMHLRAGLVHTAIEEALSPVVLRPGLSSLFGEVRSAIVSSKLEILRREVYGYRRQLTTVESKLALQKDRFLDAQLDKQSYEEAVARIEAQASALVARQAIAAAEVGNLEHHTGLAPWEPGAIQAAYRAAGPETKADLIWTIFPGGVLVGRGGAILSSPDELVFGFAGVTGEFDP
jgi:site-specific DNA recombinase